MGVIVGVIWFAGRLVDLVDVGTIDGETVGESVSAGGGAVWISLVGVELVGGSFLVCMDGKLQPKVKIKRIANRIELDLW